MEVIEGLKSEIGVKLLSINLSVYNGIGFCQNVFGAYFSVGEETRAWESLRNPAVTKSDERFALPTCLSNPSQRYTGTHPVQSISLH